MTYNIDENGDAKYKSTLRITNEPSFDLSLAAYTAIHCLGFAISTLLISWGFIMLLFMLLGNFNLAMTAKHVMNLGHRLLTADPERLAKIKIELQFIQIVLFMAVSFLRRHALLRILQVSRSCI